MAYVEVKELKGESKIIYSASISLGIAYSDDKSICSDDKEAIFQYIEEARRNFKGEIFGKVHLRTNIEDRKDRSRLGKIVGSFNVEIFRNKKYPIKNRAQ